MELSPHHIYLFKRERYYQTGGVIDTDGVTVVPNVRLDTMDTVPILKILMKRVDPQYGLVKTHYVLDVQMSNGGSYIIDPTSMQFNYRGPKGCLIAHGESNDYVRNFPGKIIKRLDHPPALIDPINKLGKMKLGLVYEYMYWEGNGPQRFIERLLENLIKYMDRRICGYCGWIEGEHKVKPKEDFQYKFRSKILLNCGRCKDVGYCGLACQKADWKWHKQLCQKVKTEDIK
jgi:hypothetical protein